MVKHDAIGWVGDKKTVDVVSLGDGDSLSTRFGHINLDAVTAEIDERIG